METIGAKSVSSGHASTCDSSPPRQCNSLFFNVRVLLRQVFQHIWSELLPFHTAPTVCPSTGLAVSRANRLLKPLARDRKGYGLTLKHEFVILGTKFFPFQAVEMVPSSLQDTVFHCLQMVSLMYPGSEVSLWIPCRSASASVIIV